MKVSENDVSYVAELANLELTPEERTRMVRDLNSILTYIDQLNEVDTSGVQPMAHVGGGTGAGALRQDQVRPGLTHEQALRNAPESDGACFRVPKVIER